METSSSQQPVTKPYRSPVHYTTESVDVEVSLSVFTDEELASEIAYRKAANQKAIFDDENLTRFFIDPADLHKIRHLFLIGREVEASQLCRELINELLGTAI
ncbi:hypothetical protein [Parvibium lacunae]|uniref:Uncharacterized protein n=1 Tax=Parvibium lacunae TaxID=1888893 RepID=A0A368L926_9BURK|nr:hypothetical protein [Parvibium lacunae]RCS59739.1 hypothetical protein DU000_03250 [Parvibium lacunae]